jgi:hypothetical protein
MSNEPDREAAEPARAPASLYERAFGSDEALRMPAPWPQYGDLLDDRDRDEMMYHRQMAMAAQSRAR